MNVGNTTTITKFILMTIMPYLGISEALSNQLAGIITAIICFIIAYLDAYYPNTLKWLKNGEPKK